MDEIERKLYSVRGDDNIKHEQKIVKKEQEKDIKSQALEILARKIYINGRGNLGIIDNFLNNKEKHILKQFLYKKEKFEYRITYKED